MTEGAAGVGQGYDTAVRLIIADYYGGETGMLLQFAVLRMRGCSFMVAGRREESGAFKTLDDIFIPESLQACPHLLCPDPNPVDPKRPARPLLFNLLTHLQAEQDEGTHINGQHGEVYEYNQLA